MLANKELTNNVWPEVYASRQSKSILNWTVTGVEKHNDQLCLVVSQDQIKGIIPLEAAGINLIGDEQLIKSRVMGLIGQPVSFIVTKIDKDNNLFTGDRAAAMKTQSERVWETIKPEQIRSVIVRRILHQRNRETGVLRIKGMFVEMDGVECFIPAHEISHAWIEDETTIPQPGDIVNAYVQKVDPEKQRIFLSLKALAEDPWPSCTTRYNKNAVYVGTVNGVADYGIFVSLEPGVNALCRHMKSGRVNKGDQVAIAITKVNPEERKISGAITRVIRKQ